MVRAERIAIRATGRSGAAATIWLRPFPNIGNFVSGETSGNPSRLMAHNRPIFCRSVRLALSNPDSVPGHLGRRSSPRHRIRGRLR